MKTESVAKITLFLVSLLLAGCTSCEYQESITKLESFSSNQWSLIFSLVEEMAKHPKNRGYRHQKHKVDLGELNSINFRDIEVLENRVNVNVGGCFDNKLFLHFSGFKNSEEKLIEISWGEPPLNKKELWRSSKL